GGTTATVQGRAVVSIRLDGSPAAGLAARTILPQGPTITNYVLFGTPASGAELELASFVYPVPKEAVVAIEPGLWLFRLEARDQAAKVVLEASLGSTDIAASSAVSLTFYLRPVDAGTGTMTVVLDLPAGNSVRLAKVVLDGTDAGYTLEPVGDRLAFSMTDLKSGDHVVSLRMLDAPGDSGKLLAVVSELMRIRRNLTSTWSRKVPAEAFNAAPASPTPVSVTRILSEASTGTVDLEWTRVSDNETGFVITWTDDLLPSTSGILKVGAGHSSYVWDAAPRGRSYSFGIKAVNDFGSNAASWPSDIAVPALLVKDLEINVEMGTAAEITFASGATVPRGTALVASLTGTFASYAWYLDGVSKGSSGSVSIDTTALLGSQHELMVKVRQSATGEYSSASMTFRVTTPAVP
ncbi:MAG: fibronectin type III domain-containing protein, partial [Spirochaetota bacterium]